MGKVGEASEVGRRSRAELSCFCRGAVRFFAFSASRVKRCTHDEGEGQMACAGPLSVEVWLRSGGVAAVKGMARWCGPADYWVWRLGGSRARMHVRWCRVAVSSGFDGAGMGWAVVALLLACLVRGGRGMACLGWGCGGGGDAGGLLRTGGGPLNSLYSLPSPPRLAPSRATGGPAI